MRFVLYVSMVPVEFWLATAALFGTTLSIFMYFRSSGIKLETRVNRIIEEKKKIISKNYLEVAEKICKRFKTQRTLSDELEEKLENISYIRFRLEDFPNDLSKVVDRLTHCFAYGFSSIFSTILFAYMPKIILDPILSFWVQIFVGAFMLVSFYRYYISSIMAISSLRKFEKLVNKIERSNTFEKLYELL